MAIINFSVKVTYMMNINDEDYDDYFFGQGVCMIEWANLIEELLPEYVIRVKIEKDLEKGFDYRRITIKGLEGMNKA